MKILITGNKGFIGKNLVNALSTEHELSFFEWGEPFPKIEGHDWVIHLGAITSTTETDVEKVIERNYDFSRIIINQCEQHNVNLQWASSASVYGLKTEFNEESPKDPKSPYAWSKFLFDRYVDKSALIGRWNNIIFQGFRYFNVYGPHEDHKNDQASPFHKFEKQAKETGIIKLFEGSGNFYRDFIHVDEVVNIHKHFLKLNESGIWNVGTGKTRSFEEIANQIASKYDAEIIYVPMPEEIKKQYQTYTCADLTNLKKLYDI